jgi:hypothetical protein
LSAKQRGIPRPPGEESGTQSTRARGGLGTTTPGVEENGLFEALGGETGKVIFFDAIADLDGIATDFAIFHVDLAGNRQIENHGDFLAAVRAHETVFHRGIGYDRWSGEAKGLGDSSLKADPSLAFQSAQSRVLESRSLGMTARGGRDVHRGRIVTLLTGES